MDTYLTRKIGCIKSTARWRWLAHRKVKSLEDPIGSRVVRPVLARVAAPHVDPLLVPLHPGSNARSTEPQGQTTPSARREVRFGSVERQIAVDRDLAGLEHIVDELKKLGDCPRVLC